MLPEAAVSPHEEANLILSSGVNDFVRVKLFASLREGRFTEKEWEYIEGTTVSRILQECAIDMKEVGVLLVNSRLAEPDYKLREGDTLSIFPLIGGG